MKVHISDYTVEWAHCDAARVVYYPHFYSWFDQGTERLFKANGLSYAVLQDKFEIFGMPLLETGSTYKSTSKLGDELVLHSWVEGWSGKTFLVRHKIMHTDGTEAVVGFEKRCMVIKAADSRNGIRAIATPEEIIRLITNEGSE
ncbi:MAG: acyl-CoA thioesterase [Proteobacteria bacterium]|nr:acyl-CoA thioesterase [Pseudomonadota bacterium]